MIKKQTKIAVLLNENRLCSSVFFVECREYFAKGKYLLALHLANKLADLRAVNAHTDKVGILPGEEKKCASNTTSVISRNYIPSAKQVWRAREKRLITVFREAMSRVASRSRRVYRADDMRHKSGRGMRCAGQKPNIFPLVVLITRIYLRATAIPRALRGEVTQPGAKSNEK